MAPTRTSACGALVRVSMALLAMSACAGRPATPLAQAAAGNDAAALRQLLGRGHDVDATGDSDGAWTPLIWAARSGALVAIDVLLDAGADVNHPGPTGDDWDATPLQHAILTRQPEAVRLLLDRGADPNLGTVARVAPLFLAAGDPDPALVTMLLAHGADSAIEDDRGARPLALAVSAGPLYGPDRPMFGGCRTDTVRVLLAHDVARQVTRNAAWHDALWWARVQGCREVLRLVGE